MATQERFQRSNLKNLKEGLALKYEYFNQVCIIDIILTNTLSK